jgi:hypothetical protein
MLALGAVLALLGFFLQAVQDTRAETGYSRPLIPVPHPSIQTFDGEKCRYLLQKTAERLGWPEPEIYVNHDGYEATCQMTFYGSQDGVPIVIDVYISVQAGWCDDCAYYCESPGNENDCRCIDIQGLPARLSSPIENQGTFLTFCDPYCNLVFKVHTLAEDNQPVDPLPVAGALYYSALEINCCQVVEALPPQDFPPADDPMPPFPASPPDESLPPVTDDPFNEDPLPPTVENPPEGFTPPFPDNPPDDPPAAPGPISRSPIVPLAGALIGTLVGWVVSLVTSTLSTSKTVIPSPPQPGTASVPPVETPSTWDEWEKRYTLPEIPAYRSPDIQENRSIHISVEDARETVLQTYANDLPAEAQTRVTNARMKKVDAGEFDAEYLQVYGKDQDYQYASAFVNPSTGEMLVCTTREINYTPVHELLHVASNSDFRQLTNEAMDEAVTEFFTHRITDQRSVIRSSQYDELGSTDVVAEIVRACGEKLLRQAYLHPGTEGVVQLRQAVDQKLGPGAFNKVVQLMGRPGASSKQMALDLVRGRGIRKPLPKDTKGR